GKYVVQTTSSVQSWKLAIWTIQSETCGARLTKRLHSTFYSLPPAPAKHTFSVRPLCCLEMCHHDLHYPSPTGNSEERRLLHSNRSARYQPGMLLPARIEVAMAGGCELQQLCLPQFSYFRVES
ncbi:unnamed protein product, partial [Urochloa humidicola]